MIVPDWKTAPRWARFVAMDSSGAWYWYAERPIVDTQTGIWCAGGHPTEAMKFAAWQTSLAARDGNTGTIELNESGKAFGSIETWHARGWTDEQLVANGYARVMP